MNESLEKKKKYIETFPPQNQDDNKEEATQLKPSATI